MACARCGQKAKQVSVTVAKDNSSNRNNTVPANTVTVAPNTAANARRNRPVYKTITRNPHLNGNLHWISDWEYVVVSLDGELMDPSTFVYACDEGWVDVITQPVIPTYGANRQVTDVAKQRLKGQVHIISFAKNNCQDCRNTLKTVDWWDSSYYTKEQAGNIVAAKLTDEDLATAAAIRTQVWNNRAKKYR